MKPAAHILDFSFLLTSLLACPSGRRKLKPAATPPRPQALKKIPAARLGILGADRGITPTDVRKFGEAIDQIGKKIAIKIYHDAVRAFENPNRERDRAACGGCWKRTVDFLATTLKKQWPRRGEIKARPSGQKPCREDSSRHA